MENISNEEERFGAAQDFINSGYDQKGFAILMELTESDYAPAENLLGICYYFGQGTIVNKTMAVKWFEKAAAKNVVEAQYYAGLCYYKGEGVNNDYNVAAKWLAMAAEGGDHRAQLLLGECYHYGYGVSANEETAFAWYKKSADQGNANAKKMLDQKKIRKRNKPEKRKSESSRLNLFVCLFLGWTGLAYFLMHDIISGILSIVCLANLVVAIIIFIFGLSSSTLVLPLMIVAIVCGIIGIGTFYFWGRSIYYAVKLNS